jgi:hypothetical protein
MTSKAVNFTGYRLFYFTAEYDYQNILALPGSFKKNTWSILIKI